MIREQIYKHIYDEINNDLLFLDQKYDDCLLGVCFRLDEGFTPCYDLNKIINKSVFINKFCFVNNLINSHPNTSFVKYTDNTIEDINYNENMLKFSDYNNCIVGIRFKKNTEVVFVYDDFLCINYLINQNNIDEEDAIEYFEYNIRGSFFGKNTPTILTLL